MKLPAEMSLQQIAHVLGGRVEGPADLKVSSVAVSPMHATENDLALVFDEKLVAKLADCKAKALVVTESASDKTEIPRIVVKRPMLAVQRMLTAVAPKRHVPPQGVHSSAVVDPSVELGDGVAIGPLVVIGPQCKIGTNTVIQPGTVLGAKVEVGENCLIGAGCLIADAVKIGNRVILQQGAILGSDGFGYATERESNLERRLRGNRDLDESSNPHLKIPHIGTVIIEDDVEIGSSTTIDRSTMGATTIGQGTKIDNQVMIAHNCRIGKEVLIIATTAVGGSCTIEDRAIISGSVCLSDHLRIGKDAIIEGMSGVMRDIPDGDVQVGIPAMGRREYIQQVVRVQRLKETNADVKKLKERVEKLEALLAENSLVKG